MKDYEKIVIQALNGELVYEQNSSKVNWQDVYEFSKEHNLHFLIFDYYENKWSEDFKKSIIYNKWREEYIFSIFEYTSALNRSQKILDNFSSNKINYLLLKGGKLQQLYANPKVRLSGDIDFLVEEGQLTLVDQIMKESGFQLDVKSDKDISYSRDGYVPFEVHFKALEPKYFENSQWFDNLIFSTKCYNKEKKVYEIAHNEELVYLMAHCVKHYSYTGSGLRNLYDIKLYIEKNRESIDFEIVFENLNRLNCLKYSIYIIEICKRFLNLNFEHNYIIDEYYLELLLNQTFISGIHGSEIYRNGDINVFSGDFITRSKQVFLKYDYMKVKYPLLIKFKFLLPIFWGIRMVSAFLSNRKLTLAFINKKNTKIIVEDRYKVNTFLSENNLSFKN